MDKANPLLFKTQSDWRKWLVANHSTKSEAYVIHFKKNSKKKGLRYEEALNEALCFGWIDGVLKSIDRDTFMLRYSPRKAKSPWSKINRDKALDLIQKGEMTEAGLAKIEEAKKNGMWEGAYTSKSAEETPMDLKRALQKSEKAKKNFDGFANTYKNMYIGWVKSAKTAVTRERRIKEVVRRSGENKKPGVN